MAYDGDFDALNGEPPTKKRKSAEDSERPLKMASTGGAHLPPTDNPYLAHWHEEPELDDYSNGYGGFRVNRTSGSSLSKFQKHQTTSEMASVAEDGPDNAFTGRPLSKQYFNILKTRRNLPVHAQR